MNANRDREYLSILTRYIRVCADYKPKLGHGAKNGYDLNEFRKIYGADPFYNWLVLDNPLMYAAHKTAGGMTSIYRQTGIGCEALFRKILQDTLSLKQDDVKWSYTIPLSGGKSRTLYLDARIPMDKVNDKEKREKIRRWIKEAAARLDVNDDVTASLTGVVFEIRQGYKSKDSKRQNADIANAATAYTKGLLPCAGILSLQIDENVALRYRAAQWVVLTGSTRNAVPYESIYGFMKDVIGYDLAGFFRRSSSILRKEVGRVLSVLLSPK